jgi:hypothetical protein
MLRAFICLLLSLITFFVYAADRRTVVATRAASPVIVDGDLSDAAWQNAQWNTDFTILNAPDEPAPLQTRLKVLFDDRNLYLGAELDETDIAHLKADARERGGAPGFRDQSAWSWGYRC